MLRLKIVEFFDSVRNELDLSTEIKIRDDIDRESFWNERREKQLEAIKQMEQAGLETVSKNVESEEVELASLLSDLCFVFESNGLIFVAKIAKTGVKQKDVDSLKGLIRFDSLSKQKNPFTRREVNIYSHAKAEMDELAEFLESLTSELAVVDVSWWFNKDHLLSKVHIGININSSLYNVFGLIEEAQRCFDYAEEIIFDLNIYCDKTYDVSSFMHQIKLNEHTIPVVNTNHENMKEFQDYCLESNRLDWLAKAYVYDDFVSRFCRINWGHLVQVEMRIDSSSALTSSIFANICSLRYLRLCYKSESEIDWSFLDPVRASLEKFCLLSSKYINLSWRMLQGMTKLEHLELHSTISIIDADAQGQVFADLVRLKLLYMDVDVSIFEQDWCFEVLTLERLIIRLDGRTLNSSSIRVNLPKLVDLDFYLHATSSGFCSHSLELSSFLAKLSHITKLTTQSTNLRDGWFKEFKNLRTLVCHEHMKERINRDMFIGLNNLEKVYLKSTSWYSLDIDVFDDLAALKELHVSDSYRFEQLQVKRSGFIRKLNKFITIKLYA